MISIRSSSGPGIVSNWFAGAMNTTCDRSGSTWGKGVFRRGPRPREQRRGRVPPPVGADLVDLVEEDDRVHRLRVAQRAHETAGHRADVCAAMAPDLGLVVDAAERHAHEL